MLKEIIEYGRSKDPTFCVAAESHYDRLLGHVDASFNRVSAADHIPLHRYIFPEYRQTVCVPGGADYNLVNLGIRYCYIINLEPMRYAKDVRAVAPLAAYTKQVLDLRRSLKHLLWDGEYCDVLGFSIKSKDKVFGGLFKSGKEQALVLQHYLGREAEAVVKFKEGRPKRYTVYRPGQPPESLSPKDPVSIPERGLAVVVAG
jgi:hypothetical protein